MQLSITRDKYKGHAKSPWLVVLPARISPTGKRKYNRFATRAAAASYIASIRLHVKQNGEKPVAMLPARLAADAAAACQLLEGSGLSLCDAVRQLLGAIHTQGVACAPFIPSGGTGAGGEVAAAPAAAPLTLADILERVDTAKSHQSEATKRGRRGVCHTLFSRNPGLSDTPLERITPELVQNTLDNTWPNNPPAWNAGRRQLHALFGWAIKRRLVRMENPVTCLELRRVKEAEITALPPEDLQKLFDACRPATDAELAAAGNISGRVAKLAAQLDLTYLRAYVAVCAFAGMRPKECTRLRWQDIDFEDSIISVRAANSKTGGQRHIEMHPTLRAWLLACRPEEYNPADHVTPSTCLELNMCALRARAGFGGGKWQNDCLRHSYATYYLKARLGEITQLQLNMGHRSAQLLYSRYVNMAGTTRDMAEQWWQIVPDNIGG